MCAATGCGMGFKSKQKIIGVTTRTRMLAGTLVGCIIVTR